MTAYQLFVLLQKMILENANVMACPVFVDGAGIKTVKQDWNETIGPYVAITSHE